MQQIVWFCKSKVQILEVKSTEMHVIIVINYIIN